ncbi:MAG: glycosyltransferase family 4 protein [Candidatus Levyibacteriota bacterium]
MRIGIDARLWHETGVGRYIRNLVWQLEQFDKKNDYVLFVQKGFTKQDLGITNERFKLIETDIRWHTVDEQFLFHKVLENELLDLVHFPYFSVPILYNKPFVITIHDLIINHFPTGKASTLPLPVYYAKRFAYQYILKQAAKKSRKVIAVSEETKKEIVKHLNVLPNKVAVTYEGVDDELSKKLKVKSEKLPFVFKNQKYFLYVGNAYPHKNIERLVEAFRLVAKEYIDVKLLLVGKSNYFYDRLKEKVTQMGLEKSVLFLGRVTDEELIGLYHHAEALVFPSLMEGFGLPGLEAMQNDCLVLASDIPVFKEIYQDAALYFNPREITSIHATIRLVLTEKKSFSHYIEKGEKQTEPFSWEKMAQETLHIYESSVGLR